MRYPTSRRELAEILKDTNSTARLPTARRDLAKIKKEQDSRRNFERHKQTINELR